MKPTDYLSVPEAASLLGVRIGTLRQRIKRGKLRVETVVGRQALTQEQVEQLKEKGFRKKSPSK